MSRPIVRRPVPAVDFDGAFDPLLARIYAARGVTDARDVKHQGLADLLRIGTLDGVDAAADLLAQHISTHGRVLVVGDYDADGATATAVLVRGIRALGHAGVDYLVPDRFRFGYGLTPGIVELAAQRAPTLIVTVDNGIASLDGVAAARARGMAVLVTDHHLPGASLPEADVIVNPNLPGARFESRALAGVGVAFYVLAALCRRLDRPVAIATQLLDLVALGTIADVVPLDRNNRILVQEGIRRIRAGRCVAGIAALVEVAGRSLQALAPKDLGYAVGPRLNAAGRLENMSVGIECLLTDDRLMARQIAESLDVINRDRRTLEAGMQEEANAVVARMRIGLEGVAPPPAVTLFDPGWHQGVVGLVAGRIKDQVHRPVVVFAPADDDFVRGSARSVAGIHVKDVLEAVAARHPGLIERFGGHAMAAGLTLLRAKVAEFGAAFAAEVARRSEPSLLDGRMHTDGELDAHDLSVDTAERLEAAGPFGSGFPEPTFDGEFRVLEVRTLKDKHLKLWLTAAPRTPPVEAIAFGWRTRPNAHLPPRDATVRVVYRLEINDYQGQRRPQLMVEHLESVEPSRVL